MGFTEKTNYLLETKSLLKDRINSLGGSITSGTTFRDYLVWLDSLYETLDEMTITGLPDSLEGKCEQEGTPTPSSPQPINITTGRQVVSVVGKNLAKIFEGTNTYTSGATTYTTTGSTNKLVVSNNLQSGDANTGYNINIATGTTQRWAYIPSNILAQPSQSLATESGTYTISLKIDGGTFSGTSTGSVRATVGIVDTSTNTARVEEIVVGGLTGNINVDRNLTFTIGTNEYIKCIGFYTQNIIFNNQEIRIQLEKGTSTTYEEYKGNDYEINLGKNLISISNVTRTLNGLTGTINGNTITISGTNTKTDANYGLVGTYTFLDFPNMLPGETYTISLDGNTSGAYFQINYYKNGTTTQGGLVNQVTGTTTFTVPSDYTGVAQAFVGIYRTATTMDTTFNVQLEKGSVASSFTPYKTPIYLGKIGTYQDYIFRNTTENPLYDSNLEEGQWYIHKEIGRVVLNGSDTTFSGISGTRNTGYSRFYVSVPNPLRQPSNVVGKVMCNRLVAGTLDATYLGNEAITSWDGGDRLYLYINDIATYNLNNANTWLQTHNLVICYALATPTNTLIEDEELINQLNEIDIFTVISEDFYN